MTACGNAKPFVHLHVHTQYSLLDGASRVPQLVARAAEQGSRALAVTDHGNLYGAFEHYHACLRLGVKPIIGVELYLSPGRERALKRPVFWGRPAQRHDDVSGQGAYTHLTALAMDCEGLRNLYRITAEAGRTGFYRRPRADLDLLAKHRRGLVVTTGCPSGEVQTRLRLGQPDEALAAASTLRDIFGPDNVYVELMDHGLEVERRVREGLLAVARQLGLPLVATNDSHFTDPADADVHDALLCVGTGAKLADEKRFRFNGTGYWLRSPQEMWAVFAELPEACDNTIVVAERVGSYEEMFRARDLLPEVAVPEGHTLASWLREQTVVGARMRYHTPLPEAIESRLHAELAVIAKMRLEPYFLIVSDITREARARGVRMGPCRGSGGGSCVCYCLGITDLDPIAHDLHFERFINPDRVSMPDIDLDFDEHRRGEMIDYVRAKYGSEHTAYIQTLGRVKSRAAIDDGARVLGLPYALADRIKRALPPTVMGKDVPLGDGLDGTHGRSEEMRELQMLMAAEPDVERVVSLARGLEGTVRDLGVHAGGVVISRASLTDVMPVHIRQEDGAQVTGFPMGPVEALGGLKMDFLGLRNLTVITDALAHIKRVTGADVAIGGLGLDDGAVFAMLARGDTDGVFQLEGAGMKSLCRQLKPSVFADIVALLALYRPGPMSAGMHTEYARRKHGLSAVTLPHPDLAEVLGGTYGVLVYQEQVLGVAKRMAGFTGGQADLLRRAVGKKKPAEMEAQRGRFVAGCTANGYSKALGGELWRLIEAFADYGFNKSHATGYALIAYQTAWLKVHYPVEYMAALLSSVAGNKARLAMYLGTCRAMGVHILPPDVNESGAEFTPVGN